MKQKLIKRILLICALMIANNCLFADVLMLPYLQAITTTSVMIMAECSNQTQVRVLYGENENMEMNRSTSYNESTDAVPETYVHRIQLDGLKPDTKYYYKVIQDGVDNYIKTFKTPPVVGLLKVAVMGDGRSQPKVFSEISAQVRATKPDIVIMTGDICFDSKYKSFKDEFFVPELLNLASSYCFFNAVGNHERFSKNTKAFTQAPLSASGRQDYYSFEIGDAIYIILSTETSCKKGSPQYVFLEKELKNTTKKWKIVAFHKSAYVGGGHNEFKPMVKVSEDLFEKYKVNLVLNGHSHFYQRNEVNGITHLTLAGGGAPLYTPELKKYTVKSAKEHHYGYFEIDGSELNFYVYNIEGKEIDRFTLNAK